jgi:menaquinone-specific isochorismate synthase
MSAAGGTQGAGRLVATTARMAGRGTGIDTAAVDLLAAAGRDGVLWQHEGSGLAGRGVALRIELPSGLTDAAAVAGVTGRLAAIQHSGDGVAGPGTGAVALGALPFAREAPGTLVVPRVVIGRRDGEAWITTVAGPGDGPSAARLAGQMAADALGGFTDPRPAPSEFTLMAMMDHDAWGGLVADAVDHIDDGALGKVVLARQVDVTANRPFVTSDVLARLLALYPRAWSSGSIASSAPAPSCWSSAAAPTSPAIRWPAPSAAAATWPPTRR